VILVLYGRDTYNKEESISSSKNEGGMKDKGK